jgi:hypothetical protein
MYWNYLIVFLSCFSFLNFIILFFISAFLVRLRRDLLGAFFEYKEPVLEKSENTEAVKSFKTWDQKYEEEIEFINRRIRQNAQEGGV